MPEVLDTQKVQTELVNVFNIKYKLPNNDPLKVDGKAIQDDRFLSAFGAVGSILTDKEEVLKGLGKLETAMLNIYPTSEYTHFFSYQEKTNERPAKDLVAYYDKKPQEKDKGVKGLLSKALKQVEKAHGIKGEVATLFGNISPQSFVDELIKKRRPFKDPGAGPGHGEYTHRIQWFIICQSEFFPHKTVEVGAVYEQIGKWFFPEVNGLTGKVNNLSLWDALVDRSDTANIFKVLGDEDFRNPNKFFPWMLKPENEKHFPILHAYLKARYAKRLENVTAEDYISRKLYGMSYEELFKMEYASDKKTEQMPKLYAVAQHFSGGQGTPVINPPKGDPIFLKADPKYGIVERSAFYKNSLSTRIRSKLWQ